MARRCVGEMKRLTSGESATASAEKSDGLQVSGEASGC